MRLVRPLVLILTLTTFVGVVEAEDENIVDLRTQCESEEWDACHKLAIKTRLSNQEAALRYYRLACDHNIQQSCETLTKWQEGLTRQDQRVVRLLKEIGYTLAFIITAIWILLRISKYAHEMRPSTANVSTKSFPTGKIPLSVLVERSATLAGSRALYQKAAIYISIFVTAIIAEYANTKASVASGWIVEDSLNVVALIAIFFAIKILLSYAIWHWHRDKEIKRVSIQCPLCRLELVPLVSFGSGYDCACKGLCPKCKVQIIEVDKVDDVEKA